MKLFDHEKKHLRELRKSAAGCTLFLKRNGDFPLDAPCEIGLYGSGARQTRKGGTGSGDVNSRFYVTAEKGLERAGFTITSKDWIDRYDQVKKENHEHFVKQIKSEALKSGMLPIQYSMGKVECDCDYDIPLGSGDTAVYVLSRICGEGADRQWVRGDILLTKTEISDILQLKANYKRFMLVLNVGGPVDLSPVVESVDNILLLSQLGAVTGVVLADILLGKADPSGKLTATWIAEKDRESIGEFGDINNTRYKEGVYVGYRYYETEGVKPLFPFGFGKSYTDFELQPESAGLHDGILEVSVSVKNTGSRAGREVVEVYASLPDDRIDQPVRVLAGFEKSPVIEAGEEKTVSVKVDLRDIASFDEIAACYIIPAGDTIISVGEDSSDVKTVCVLRAAIDIRIKQVRNSLGETDFTDFVPEKKRTETVDTDLKEITDFSPEKINADQDSDDVSENNETVSTANIVDSNESDKAAENNVADKSVGTNIIELSENDIECTEVFYDDAEPVDPIAAQMTDEELALASVGAFGDSAVASVIGQAGQKVPGSAGETYENNEKGIRGLVMADGPAGLRLDRKYGVDSNGVYSYGNPMFNSMLEFSPRVAQIYPAIQRKKAERRTARGGEVKYQFATAIPIGTAIAQSWDVEFARDCGYIVGSEMEIYDVDIWLAPALNVQRDIRCGRNFEYFSEDPLISGYMAAAITNGVQEHEGRYVTLKHYAANNQETNRMASNSCVSERTLREIYLRGFEIAVRKSSPAFVMNSYNLINGVHTSERHDLITDVLRSEFGFEGAVMTDWIVPGMTNKNSEWSYPDPAKVAAAGTSVFMPGTKHDYEDILTGHKTGKVTREQLEINVTRLLQFASEQ